jgi:hypothetical protein
MNEKFNQTKFILFSIHFLLSNNFEDKKRKAALRKQFYGFNNF